MPDKTRRVSIAGTRYSVITFLTGLIDKMLTEYASMISILSLHVFTFLLISRLIPDDSVENCASCCKKYKCYACAIKIK